MICGTWRCSCVCCNNRFRGPKACPPQPPPNPDGALARRRAAVLAASGVERFCECSPEVWAERCADCGLRTTLARDTARHA